MIYFLKIYWYQLISGQERRGFRSILVLLLRVLSFFYGAAVFLRNKLYDLKIFKVRKSPVPVISIGNISMGGTGKTTVTLWCAKVLKDLGFKPAIVSRGYGRLKCTEDPFVVSNGKETVGDWKECGEEPFLLSKNLPDIPVVVSRNRYEASRTAVGKFGCDCILMDDGFQHRSLHRNINLLCMDERTFRMGSIFPSGYLRETFDSIRRADFLLFKEQGKNIESLEAFKKTILKYSKPFARYRYLADRLVYLPDKSTEPVSFVTNKKIAVCSALSDPQGFKNMLLAYGALIVGEFTFPDHHLFTQDERDTILKFAKSNDAVIVASAKDAVKFPNEFPAYILEIKIEWLEGEANLKTFIEEKLKTFRHVQE